MSEPKVEVECSRGHEHRLLVHWRAYELEAVESRYDVPVAVIAGSVVADVLHLGSVGYLVRVGYGVHHDWIIGADDDMLVFGLRRAGGPLLGEAAYGAVVRRIVSGIVRRIVGRIVGGIVGGIS